MGLNLFRKCENIACVMEPQFACNRRGKREERLATEKHDKITIFPAHNSKIQQYYCDLCTFPSETGIIVLSA